MSEAPKTPEQPKKEAKGTSRRNFLIGTVGGLVVGAAAGSVAGSLGFPTIPTSVSEPWIPAKWDYTADVVVVGYGGSGAVTAISAFDAGAKVLILEKQPSWASLGVSSPAVSGGGGNTIMNAGFADYVTNPTAAANYIYEAGWGNTPMSVCQALAQSETDTTTWLTQMGIKNTVFPGTSAPAFPSLGGANAFGSISLTSGFAWFQQLDALVQKRGIPILFNTSATDLIQNGKTKEILGVAATTGATSTSSGTAINVRANRAVVLATGSFEFNENMKSQYLRVYPLHGQGCQFCTGDSVTMASKVGAAMWHMDSMSLGLVAWFPEYPIAFGSATPSQNGWIYVDINGQRWINEQEAGFAGYPWNFALELSDFDLTVPAYTRIPTFIIFDEACRKAGAISSGSTGQLPTQIDPRPTWSSDNSAEISKGWILQGATIAALAAAINGQTYAGVPSSSGNSGPAAKITVNMDPDVLTATVNAWNASCTAKVDSQFGRPAATLVPIQTSPFYAMPLWPGGPSLYGGPVRNAQGQICDAYNNPIPRLYGVGESGNLGGGFLDVVTNNGQMIGLGRLVGKNTAAEAPWTS